MIRRVVIIVYIINSIYDFFLLALEAFSSSRPLPENVKDVYSREEYIRHLSYQKDKRKIELYALILSASLNFIFLVENVYARLFNLFEGRNILIQYLAVIVILEIISTLIKLPFSIYSTFVIEEKYGMNRTTKKTYILDTIKSFILSLILTFLLISLIIYFFSRYGIRGVIGTSIAVITLTLIISALIIPLLRLFNKFTPLEDGILKEKLLEITAKNNMEVKRIVVRDASRRTTTSNAFCTGIRKKTIALDDNLVKNFSTDEIVAVFAHEAGHAKMKHALKSLPLSILSSVLTILAFGFLLEYTPFFSSFGFKSVNYLFAFILLGTIFKPFDIIGGIITNYISRKHEYEADKFAADEGYGESLISALKKLHRDALSEINPPKWIIITEYSHPTLSERISAVELER